MTDLLKALDTAVARLLEQAGLGETKPEKVEATAAEAVKAFNSAMEYAKIRPTLAPKETKESEFDRIQREFSGERSKTERRGRPRKAAPAPDPAGESVPAANGVDTSLFGP